jgi:hypothetical protein
MMKTLTIIGEQIIVGTTTIGQHMAQMRMIKHTGMIAATLFNRSDSSKMTAIVQMPLRPPHTKEQLNCNEINQLHDISREVFCNLPEVLQKRGGISVPLL